MICMAMIKGITVTLYEKEKINEDPFGKLIYKETPTKVENVLVASTNTQEVLDALNLTGKKAVPFPSENSGKRKQNDRGISRRHFIHSS